MDTRFGTVQSADETVKFARTHGAGRGGTALTVPALSHVALPEYIVNAIPETTDIGRMWGPEPYAVYSMLFVQ